MQQQRNDQSNPLDDMRRASNGLIWACFVWASVILLFTRQRFGSRFMGYHVFLGLVWAAMFPTLFPGQDPRVMWMFALAAFGLLLMHADARRQLAKKGIAIHSMYSGDSRVPGKTAKTQWEPALVAFAGLGLLYVNVPLGAFLIGGGIASGVFSAAVQQKDNADRRAIRDALLEASYREEVMNDEREKMGMQ